MLASDLADIGESAWVDPNDTYEEQCGDAYRKLSSRTPNLTINGTIIDGSYVRESEDKLRDSFADLMDSAGYDRYYSYEIADWFRYTNFAEYFIGYCYKIIPICFLTIAFSVIFTLLVNREAKKEIVVYEDFVLCKINSKKAKQLVFADISSIDIGKNKMKLVGARFSFKISNIANAETIKSAIMSKKKSSQNNTNYSGAYVEKNIADELKEYKELLDSGIISQDDFDQKKKQILGL